MKKVDKRKNCDYKIKDNKLVITIDLSKDPSLSSSGKSYLLATTGGNISLVGDYKDVKLGINCYIPSGVYEQKLQDQKNLEDTKRVGKEARSSSLTKKEIDLDKENKELKALLKQLMTKIG